MYSDNFMTQRYTLHRENANENTKCGVVFLDTSCMLSDMEWYKKAKRIMAERKIRQEDLIEVFGVTTRGAVGHYLTGRRQPDPAQMKSLADRLGCSLDELLSESEPDPLQLQVNKIIRAAEKAIKTSSHQFTDAERARIYQVAFAAGLGIDITDEHLDKYIQAFIQK